MKILLSGLSLLVVSASAMADSQFSLGTGFDYSTGKYGGTKSVNILYIPVVATYESDRLTLKLTVPYIAIWGAGAGVFPGLGRTKPATTGKTVTTAHAGLGDVIASAGYDVYQGEALTLDLVGKVKLGTADKNKGLGTGMNDYSAQVDGYYAVRKTTFFATAGYKIVGVPAGMTLNNVAFGTIGVAQKLDGRTTAGVMFDAAQSPSPTGAPPQTVTAYLSRKLGDTVKFQPYVLKGVSSGSPDFGFGALITGTW